MSESFEYIPLSRVQRTVILDTDIGPDCDDAGAIACLLFWQERYHFPIVGIVNCTSNPYANGAIRAITRCLGHEIPVAASMAPGLLEDAYQFDEPITRNYLEKESDRTDAIRALDFYRDALSKAEDRSVTIISIGQFTTISKLLKAEPELVRQKVYALISMACAFPSGREFNIHKDAKAAQHVFKEFPSPIICTGFEIGLDVLTGFYNPPENNALRPVYDAYRIYTHDVIGDTTAESLRHSWDLTAVQFAAEGRGRFYDISDPVDILIDDDGSNRIQPWNGAGTPRYYLIQKTDNTTLASYLNQTLHRKPTHLLVYAAQKTSQGTAPGTERKEYLRGRIDRLLSQNSVDDLRMVLIDITGSGTSPELSGYNRFRHLLGSLITDPRIGLAALIKIEKMMMERFVTISSSGVHSLEEHNLRVLPSLRIPRLVVVADGIEKIINAYPERSCEVLSHILRLGAAAGIELLLTTHEPPEESIPAEIRRLMPNRLVLK
ncbi:MAG: nucleoside hydrolase [Firmicutes bacterium]|nr:nucleoside hydrolase [Bacillota bacterium]